MPCGVFDWPDDEPEPALGELEKLRAALDAVDRFAQEIDAPPEGVVDTGGYMDGYAAARRELRALRGIEA